MPATTVAPQQDKRRTDIFIAALVAVAVIALMVGWSAARGALGASRNDDFGFYRVTFRLAADGQFVLDGWGGMFFLGQALLALPIVKAFGPEPLPLQVMVAVLAVIGLWASYLLVRGFIPRGYAFLAVGCLALGPMFGSLAVSYMTDVPGMALSVAALVIAAAGVSKARPMAWFVAALAVTTLAFTIREYAVAAGVAAVVVHLLHSRSPRRVFALSAAWFALLVAMVAWRSGLEHTVSYEVDLSFGSVLNGGETLCATLFTLAFFVSPAVAAVSFRRLPSGVGRVFAPAIVMGVGIVGVAVRSGGFVGNYFSRRGAGASFWSGTGAPLVPTPVLLVTVAIAAASTVLLTVLASRAVVGLWGWGRQRPPRHVPRDVVDVLRKQSPSLVIAWTYLAVFGSILVAVILVFDAPFFDRYLISLVPITAALVTWGYAALGVQPTPATSGRGQWLAAAVASTVLVFTGFALFDGLATRDGLAWEMAEELVAEGVPVERIDGGAWQGLHQADYWMRVDRPSTACVEVSHEGQGSDLDVVVAERRRTLVGATVGFDVIVTDPDDPDCAPLVNAGEGPP